MDLLDAELAQLVYVERLREAERKRRLLYLSRETAEQARVAQAPGLVQQIRDWLRARTERREAADVRRTHAI
jgi:hypothetical protein